MSKPTNNCPGEEKIIQLAYRELDFFSRRAVQKHLWKCKQCQKLYTEYVSLLRNMRQLPEMGPPPHMLRHLYRASAGRSGFFRMIRIVLPATVMLLAVGIVIWTGNNQISRRDHFTQQQIRQAEKDVHAALSILARSLNKTGHKIDRKKIPQKINGPIQKSVQSTFQHLCNGG